MGWTKHIEDEQQLAGMPESALAAAKAAAQAKELDGYLLTLDIPSYLPVMTYCDNQALRKELYRHTRPELLTEVQMQESGTIQRLSMNSSSCAMKSPVCLVLIPLVRSLWRLKWQKILLQLSFLNDLCKAKPQGEKEVEELRQFAKREYGVEELELWDITYYSEKQKQHCSRFR